jgi:ATP/maltotriose-dependent transcriptional regulator MalT
LLAARDELAASRPGMTGEAIVRLADLRRRQGRLVEAAELLDKIPSSGAALLARAELAFDRGDPALAVEQVLRFLRHVPTQNRTERASGLDVLVRASISICEKERGKAALAELQNIAEILDTVPMRATASFAAGYVALADELPEASRRCFEDAVDLLCQSGAPFELARARIHLGRALSELGRNDEAVEQLKSAIEVLAGLNAEVEIATANRILSSIRGRVAGEHSEGDSGETIRSPLSRREIEVLRLVAEGLSNQAIAARLFVSDHTVHRHLANILNKLNVCTRAAAVAQAVRTGLLS